MIQVKNRHSVVPPDHAAQGSHRYYLQVPILQLLIISEPESNVAEGDSSQGPVYLPLITVLRLFEFCLDWAGVVSHLFCGAGFELASEALHSHHLEEEPKTIKYVKQVTLAVGLSLGLVVIPHYCLQY